MKAHRYIWALAAAVGLFHAGCGSDDTGDGDKGRSQASSGTGSGEASSGASTGSGMGGAGGGSAATSSSSSSSSTSSSSGAGGGSGGTDATQICVDKINQYRATLKLPPYQRWTAEESCTSEQAKKDSQSGTPHGAFGQCTEFAQDECPGWPGPPSQMIGSCLQMMWNEGPGGGHYDNMSSTRYTKVACGFYVLPSGKVWATQDFR